MSIITPMVRPMVRPMVTAMGEGGQRSPAQIIKSLFAQGQQGFWLPFTDFASLSQDSAGTLPYTALEQPVGMVLDRSGRGNHASQPTSTARGAVSARVNQLVQTESFTEVEWVKAAGTFAGSKFTENLAVASARGCQQANGLFLANSNLSFKARVSAAGRTWALLWDTYNNRRVWFNLVTGVVGSKLGATGSITAVGAGVYDCEMVFTNPTAAVNMRVGPAPSDSTAFYDGDGVSGINIFRTSLTLAAQAALPYQRVTTPTDYDAVGFPKSLRLDGTDDYYTCGGGGSTTGFYYADVIQLAVNTATSIFQDAVSNKGYILLVASGTLKLKMYAGDGTTLTSFESTTSLVIGKKHFVECYDDGVNLGIVIDGGTPTTIPRPAVQGGSPVMQLFKANGVPTFNGNITEPIYRAGPPPSAYERSVIRTYQMQKAGML